MKQMYTQNGGVRPFGSALIIGGINKGNCRLFETDPSGALIEYKATAIGAGRNEAMDVFEEKYDDDLTLNQAIDLALDAIYEATDGKTTKDNVEIAVIEKETGKYRKLDDDEVATYVESLLERNKEEDEEDSEDETEEDSDSEEE